jgi:hypothetical protein
MRCDAMRCPRLRASSCHTAAITHMRRSCSRSQLPDGDWLCAECDVRAADRVRPCAICGEKSHSASSCLSRARCLLCTEASDAERADGWPAAAFFGTWPMDTCTSAGGKRGLVHLTWYALA